MSEGDKKPEGEQPSEEFVKFEAAMRQIVTVQKEDIVERLPKMFQERKATTKTKVVRKRKTKMNHSEALLLLMKHEVDVVACESNGPQDVKVELGSGEVFVGKSFEPLLERVIEQ